MAPIVHIVRHAEGFHNSAKWGEGIHDPFLTEKGKQQCEQLRVSFPYHSKVDLLMASPMKRTIQTCQIAFDPVVQRGQKILLMPLAQETSDTPMDTGSTTEELQEAFGDLIDAQRLSLFPYWYRNVGPFGAKPHALIQRARLLRQAIRKRPESNIVLVSHGSFAHFITGNIDPEGEEVTRMWTNAECRSYQFASENDQDDDAQLVELESSKKNREDLEKKVGGYLLSVGGERRSSAGEILVDEKGEQHATTIASVAG